MALSDLYNTTIQVKSESSTLSGDQRVETHAAAGTALPARIEHIGAEILNTMSGEIARQVYKFYIPAGTTIKAGDVIVDTDSVEYKVISALKAYGMSVVDHIEVTAVKL